ncbi:MAG: hypothetical protein JW861_14520 [Bacteroidales bacterium]|nr:hypothetical protein [Bacteroidales bacterium]
MKSVKWFVLLPALLPTLLFSQEKAVSIFEQIVRQAVNDTARQVVTRQDNGVVNWTLQYVTVTGRSVLDTASYKIAGQAELMAIQGAKTDAYRNLLETSKGIRVVSETTVRDMITQDDFIYSRVEGVIRNAEMTGEPVIRGNIAEVAFRLPVYKPNAGLADIMQEALDIPALKSSGAGEPDDQPTPVMAALNIQGGYNPTMFPSILDESGNVVLDLSTLYNANNGMFPRILNISSDIASLLQQDKAVNMINMIQDADGTLRIDAPDAGKAGQWIEVLKKVKNIGSEILLLTKK